MFSQIDKVELAISIYGLGHGRSKLNSIGWALDWHTTGVDSSFLNENKLLNPGSFKQQTRNRWVKQCA